MAEEQKNQEQVQEQDIDINEQDLMEMEEDLKRLAEIEELRAKIRNKYKRKKVDFVELAKQCVKESRTSTMFDSMLGSFKAHKFQADKGGPVLEPERILKLHYLDKTVKPERAGEPKQKTFGSKKYTVSETMQVRFNVTLIEVVPEQATDGTKDAKPKHTTDGEGNLEVTKKSAAK